MDHTAWELSTGYVAGLTAGNQGFNFSTVGTSPATLLRIRREIVGNMDAATAVAAGIQLTYGIILVPEGSGTTVQFTPVGDANAPWLLWGTGFVGYEEGVTDVIDYPGLTSFRHVIDNKAMRRIRPDVEMQFVLETTTALGSGSVNLNYSLRWLQGF